MRIQNEKNKNNLVFFYIYSNNNAINDNKSDR